MGVIDLKRKLVKTLGDLENVQHLKRNCIFEDEIAIASVIKPDGTEFLKMMCRNCGKIWLDVYQDEGLLIG